MSLADAKYYESLTLNAIPPFRYFADGQKRRWKVEWFYLLFAGADDTGSNFVWRLPRSFRHMLGHFPIGAWISA